MASGDQFGFFVAKDLTPQNGLAYEVPLSAVVPPVAATNLGGAPSGILGVPLNKDGSHSYQVASRVWHNGTPLPTGLTFTLGLVDDPMNPNASGAIVVGITVKPVISGTSDYSQTSAGAEVLTTITMPATSGVDKSTTIAIANASLASLAAGNQFVVQVRRVGPSNAADTHTGVVLLTSLTISDT
jgi:hypothetical protein